MPQTVPKRPMKGAVEPTVARKARPSCRRLCTSSRLRWTFIETQELWSMFSVRAPSWCSLASRPVSAMKRKAEPVFRPFAHALRFEEGPVRRPRLTRQLQALVEFGDEDVPTAHAHDGQDDERAAR